MRRRPPSFPLFPYTTLFRSDRVGTGERRCQQLEIPVGQNQACRLHAGRVVRILDRDLEQLRVPVDRKSTRLNSSHTVISYAVFCLKKKKTTDDRHKTRNGSK